MSTTRSTSTGDNEMNMGKLLSDAGRRKSRNSKQREKALKRRRNPPPDVEESVVKKKTRNRKGKVDVKGKYNTIIKTGDNCTINVKPPSKENKGPVQVKPMESTPYIAAEPFNTGIGVLSNIQPHQVQQAIVLKVVAKPRLSKGEQTECLKFLVSDNIGITVRTCVAFGEEAQRFYSEICEGGIYTFSQFSTRKPNDKFSKDPVEILLDDCTVIERILEESDDFKCSLAYRGIDKALKTSERSHIRAKITRIGEVKDSPEGKMKVREVHVVDKGLQETKVVFLKKDAETFDFQVDQSVQITFVRAKKYQDEEYLITTPFTTISACENQNQIQVDGYKPAPLPTQTYIKIETLRELKTALGEETYEIQNVCTIETISVSNPMYFGCTELNCRKKVECGLNNIAVCPQHGFQYDTQLFFKIPVLITDHRSKVWITLFDRHVASISDLTTDMIDKLSRKRRSDKIIQNLKNVKIKVTIKKEKGLEYTVIKISKV